MEDTVLPTLEQHFGNLTDPRIDRTKLHELFDICALIAGADNRKDVEEFRKARLDSVPLTDLYLWDLGDGQA